MRIDLNSNFLPPEGTQAVKSGARASEAAAHSGVASDSAKLSSDHLSAASLAAAVNQLPELRQEKVAALAEKLRSGTYEVSAKQTAEAMISQMRVSSAA